MEVVAEEGEKRQEVGEMVEERMPIEEGERLLW